MPSDQSVLAPATRSPLARRAPWWLAAVAAVGLLLVFGWVVGQGVARGAERQTSRSVEADAIWRCHTVPGRAERQDCRLRAQAAAASR